MPDALVQEQRAMLISLVIFFPQRNSASNECLLDCPHIYYDKATGFITLSLLMLYNSKGRDNDARSVGLMH